MERKNDGGGENRMAETPIGLSIHFGTVFDCASHHGQSAVRWATNARRETPEHDPEPVIERKCIK